ncbi:MAG: hypothetical protein ACTTJS_08470 [Wolinella sp.]
MKIDKILIAVFTISTLTFAKDTWLQEASSYLFDIPSERVIEVKLDSQDPEFQPMFYSCGIDNPFGYLDCTEIEDGIDFPIKLSYFSLRIETPNMLGDGRYGYDEQMRIFNNFDKELIKKSGSKIRTYKSKAVHKYTYEIPIFAKDGLISSVTIGNDGTTYLKNSYAIYKDNEPATLRPSEALIAKMNKSSNDQIVSIDEMATAFIFKDKVYIEQADITYKNGKKEDGELKFISFDLNEIKDFIIPIKD